MKNAGFAKFVVLVNGSVPLAVLSWDAWQHELGANPSEYALRTTGMTALVFLMLSLCVTPVRKLTGYNALSHFRRTLGLYAFFYGIVHFGIWLVLDMSIDFQAAFNDTLKRPFILIGMSALFAMIPLAITSTNVMIKAMGAAKWKRLHRLAYVAGIGGVAHFYMLVKANVRLPLAFAGVLTVLLGYRVIAGARGWVRRRNVAMPPARAG